ncbi:MAG TPA: metallophosphoesterase [Armatimonadota bacterium]
MLTVAVAVALVVAGADRVLPRFSGPLPAGLPQLLRDQELTYPPAERWTFAVLGDTQWHPEMAALVLAAAQRDRPSLIFDVGDAVDYGGRRDWEFYLRHVAAVWDGTPFFQVPGDHDRGWDGAWWTTATLERHGGARYRAINQGSWTILLLDSSEWQLDGRQREWLAAKLAELGPQRNLIVLTHMPPADPRTYAHVAHSMGRVGEAQLAGLLAGYRVRLIVTGHVHVDLASQWRGIPVLTTAMNYDTWRSPQDPARWLLFTVRGDEITWQWKALERPAEWEPGS